MLDELAEQKKGLEEKIDSLLDLLYGCYQCGRHGDFCECDTIDKIVMILLHMTCMNYINYPLLLLQKQHHMYPNLLAPHLHGRHLLLLHAAAVGHKITALALAACVLPASLL